MSEGGFPYFCYVRRRTGEYSELVVTGVIRPAVETGDPLVDWPSARAVALPRGTAAALIDEYRGA
jgi:hypothetical protein